VTLAIMLPVESILLHEPTAPPECVAVNVTGFWHGYRQQQFTVATSPASADAGAQQLWSPGRFASEFDTLYRGPAVLVIRHGHWVGDNHLHLTRHCPVSDDGSASVVMSRDPDRPGGNLDNDSTVLLRIFTVLGAIYLPLFLVWRRFSSSRTTRRHA
jgi:hypothetical protein